MNEISCEVCVDLIPLVQDGVASTGSCDAVERHIHSCPSCKALFEGELPPSDNAKAMKTVQRKSRIFWAMALMFGIFCGVSLSASSEMLFNALLMPLIGTVGFYLFHWRAAYLIPCLLFVTHGISNILAFVRNTGHLALTELMLYIGAYCVYALFGVVVTGLLCYVFGKEDGK